MLFDRTIVFGLWRGSALIPCAEGSLTIERDGLKGESYSLCEAIIQIAQLALNLMKRLAKPKPLAPAAWKS
jgi:hypothetical protein